MAAMEEILAAVKAAQQPFTAAAQGAAEAGSAVAALTDAFDACADGARQVEEQAAQAAACVYVPQTENDLGAGAAPPAAPGGAASENGLLYVRQWTLTAQSAQEAAQSVQGFDGAVFAAGAALTAGRALLEGAAGAAGLLAGALGGAAAAQSLLTASMLPAAAVLLGAVALVYMAAQAVSAATGTAVSGAGLICASIAGALAFVGNLFVALWNTCVDVFALLYDLVATVADFIGTVFINPVNAVGRLFFSLANTVLGVLRTLAGAIDAIFGTSLAAGVQSWQNKLGAWTDKTFGKGAEVMAKLDTDRLKLPRFDYGDAARNGYVFGEGLTNGSELPAWFQTLTASGGELLVIPGAQDDGEVKTSVRRIAASTRAIQSAVSGAGEDLKYLRDVAEAEAVNRFTTAQIKIEQTNNNTIADTLDIDGVVSALTSAVGEAMSMMTEGVYA